MTRDDLIDIIIEVNQDTPIKSEGVTIIKEIANQLIDDIESRVKVAISELEDMETKQAYNTLTQLAKDIY